MKRRVDISFSQQTSWSTILISAIFFFTFTTSAVLAQEASAGAPKASQPVDLMWGVKIPLRDGVRLNATVYRPHLQKDPLPVILELTPYISDTYHEWGLLLRPAWLRIRHCRRSRKRQLEGKFNPFFDEAQNGYDVVEWLAKQPWSNGKIAMWGGSYTGFDQWMTLREEPPHLATVIP